MKYSVSVICCFIFLLHLILFSYGVYPPIAISLTLILVCSFFLFYLFKKKYFSELTLIFYIVYMLPSIHLFQYLLFDITFLKKLSYLWGVRVNPYMFDIEIIKFTTLFFSLPSLAFVQGAVLTDKKINSLHLNIYNKKLYKPINSFLWYFVLMLGVVLSLISAPKDSIFTTGYRLSTPLNFNMGFDSAWLFSYILITFCFVDAFLSKHLSIRKISVVISVFYIVVFLQLLRGDRESLPWLFALLILHVKFLKSKTKRPSKRIFFKISIITLLIIFGGFVIGYIRSKSVGLNYSDIFEISFNLIKNPEIFLMFFNGTWSAVLLTPLSVAGDFYFGFSSFLLGHDYLNFVLSLPPGFVCDIFDYTKPLNVSSGPAQEMRFGLGGVHASILPFRNFGILGIYILPLLYFVLIKKVDKYVNIKPSFSNLTLFCSLIFVLPHWLWYSDKILINMFIMWFVSNLLFKIRLTKKCVES